MRPVSLPVIVALLALLGIQSAHAENTAVDGNADAGQSKSAICAACHGADGNSAVAQWPKIAGQHQSYLLRQIKLIQSGARAVPEMAPMVANLSEQDIADLAAYYAAQTLKTGVADDRLQSLGEKLYVSGNADTGVPACAACHGATGQGNPAAGYPVIAGQHSLYLSNNLKNFRAGGHYGADDAESQVMVGVAKFLTDEEIQAVSSYLEGLHEVTE